jgi:hypothetical protein
MVNEATTVPLCRQLLAGFVNWFWFSRRGKEGNYSGCGQPGRYPPKISINLLLVTRFLTTKAGAPFVEPGQALDVPNDWLCRCTSLLEF